MIQIETLEPIQMAHLLLGQGDRITVADEIAQRWCEAGIVKAVHGEFSTGPRKVVKSVIELHNAVQVEKVTEVISNG